MIEHNLIEDNDDQALFIEAGYDARVRYNTMRRNSQCEAEVENDIPDGIDKYRCRWST